MALKISQKHTHFTERQSWGSTLWSGALRLAERVYNWLQSFVVFSAHPSNKSLPTSGPEVITYSPPGPGAFDGLNNVCNTSDPAALFCVQYHVTGRTDGKQQNLNHAPHLPRLFIQGEYTKPLLGMCLAPCKVLDRPARR